MSAAFSRRHLRTRKLKAEINVVPYIDVMLVLLIIFMITAPLLNLGVDVNLPEANAKAVDVKQDPVTLSVTADGAYTLKLADANGKPVNVEELEAEMRALLAANPKQAVYVAGDGAASYAMVLQAMVHLQKAGVSQVGLMTKPSEAEAR